MIENLIQALNDDTVKAAFEEWLEIEASVLRVRADAHATTDDKVRSAW